MKFGLANIATLCAALGHPEARSPRSSSPAPTARARSRRWSTPRCAPPDTAARATRRRTSSASRSGSSSTGEEVAPERSSRGRARARSRRDARRVGRARRRCRPSSSARRRSRSSCSATRGVDIAVLEVGLGGRLDATNIVSPIAAAIVSIDFDHEAQLGDTLASIAAEKAGVIKPGIPVVCGPLPAEALDVIAGGLREQRRATLIRTDTDAALAARVAAHADRAAGRAPAGQRRGRAAAAGSDRRRHGARAARRRRTRCARGSTTAVWPGRLETLHRRRLPGPARRGAQSGRRARAGVLPA